VATLTQRCEQLIAPQLAVLVRFVDPEIRCRGIIENQIDVEAQQVGAAQEHVAFDLIRPDGEKIERAVGRP